MDGDDEDRAMLEAATDDYIRWGCFKEAMRMKWLKVLPEIQQRGT